MNEILENERAKYDLAYRDEWYRSTNQGMELLKNFPGFFPTSISSFLDIGCGDGRLVQYMLDRGVGAYGVDFVEVPTMTLDRSRFIKASFYGEGDRSLEPLKLRMQTRFEFATCLDVMEHIPEQYVDETLANICPLADTILFEIANYPSGFNNHFGPLHLTLHPAEWWLDKLSEHGTAELTDYHRAGVEEYLIWFHPRRESR